MDDANQSKQEIEMAVPICPLSLSGQVNGVYYWYAEDCPTHIPYLIATDVEVQTGCREGNEDCRHIFRLHSSGGDADPGHCFLRGSDLRSRGLGRRMASDETPWFGAGTSLLSCEDRDLSHDGVPKRVRLFSLAYHPPHRLGDPGLNRVVMIGIGQELAAPPAGEGEPLVVEEHEDGECYFKLRSGDGEVAKHFHVLMLKN